VVFVSGFEKRGEVLNIKMNQIREEKLMHEGDPIILTGSSVNPPSQL
jgi:hypothetical protein